jgi:two-component system cell cycle sensor histidine kinase/response regulator CckA
VPDANKSKQQLLEALESAERKLESEVLRREGAEDLLRQKSAEIDAFFRALPDLSFRLGEDGVILDFHAGRESDLYTTPERFLGRRMEEVLPVDVGKQFVEAVGRVREGSIVSVDYALPLPSGEKIFEARMIPLIDDQTYILVRDITDSRRAERERLELEAQMQEAQKLESLGVLAGGIAHDFNNILTGLLGNTSLALEELSTDSQARAYLLEIERAGRRVADLTNQMLAYSGRGKFVVEDIEINAIVEDMTSLLESSTSAKPGVKHDLLPRLPAVRGDATQIRQVVLNLVSNASDAIADRGGSVSVGTYVSDCSAGCVGETRLSEELDEGPYVTIEVADSGCGMDAETQKKIFDPFFTTKFTGRGLGLAAVQGIVRSHGGAILVASEVGRGTTFKVLLPALDHVASVEALTETEDDWHGSGTILLAEDEEMVRTVTVRMLERLGFTVLTASNGVEAVERFREHASEIVCVLLDLKMPHMDGEEAFEELRRVASDVTVILCSGYSELESVERFSDKGLAGFLQKPFGTARLKETLQAALGS